MIHDVMRLWTNLISAVLDRQPSVRRAFVSVVIRLERPSMGWLSVESRDPVLTNGESDESVPVIIQVTRIQRR